MSRLFIHQWRLTLSRNPYRTGINFQDFDIPLEEGEILEEKVEKLRKEVCELRLKEGDIIPFIYEKENHYYIRIYNQVTK